MARYGSERIRGHGIPEAIEAILIGGSRVEPKVALLKPLSSAISIGSGGPFGAEGPIIMTGGAVGSLVAQFFHLTSAERKTLLVAGAAAGMSATFASPLAAVLLAVELLLFEWKPRSFVPVALASATAACGAPLPHRRSARCSRSPPHPLFIGAAGLAGCVVAGLLAGALSALLTWRRLCRPRTSSSSCRSTGCGGRRSADWRSASAGSSSRRRSASATTPSARCCTGDVPRARHPRLLLVKSTIWVDLARLGHLGRRARAAADDGRRARRRSKRMVLPGVGVGFWPLVSMGAILGGTMRSPFTGIVFALELTHDVNMLLPLLVAVTVAHALHGADAAALDPDREDSRRGFHLSREYAVDPLEILFVREVVRTQVVALPADATARCIRDLVYP